MDTNQFSGHGLWQFIRETLEWLDEVEDQTPEAAKGDAQRIRAVAGHILAFSNAPDAYSIFASTAMLDNVYSQWNQVRNYVTNHRNNPSAGFLAQASPYLDGVLSVIASWPIQGLKGGAAAHAASTFGEYQAITNATITTLKEDIERLVEQRNSQDAQFGDAQAKLEALEGKITQDETRLDTAVTQHVDAFNKSQTERDEHFARWLDTQKAKFSDEVAGYRAQLDGDATHAGNVLKNMEALYKKTENVASDTTAAKMAKDYGTYATREFNSAMASYIVGVLLLVCAGVFLFLTIKAVGPTEKPSWQWVSLKVGLAATIVSAGTIAIRLGSRFLSNSTTNKRIELELRAIGPFLADVDDADSAVGRAKLEFVGKAFGRTWDEKQQMNEAVDVGTLDKMVDALSAVVNRLGK